MRVLVTGATGFVGRHVIQHLIERGHDVTAVARTESKARSFTWFDRVRFIACDIHQKASLDQWGHQDALLHLAWDGLPNYTALFHCEKNLHADYYFLKSIVEQGVKQILVTGTCLEYGNKSGELAEDLPTYPTVSYAVAKDALRKFMQLLQQEQPFSLQWARLFYMYGDGQNPHSLLAQLDRAIANGETSFNMSGGEQLRDYLPVNVVALRLVKLLEHPECDGVVNICSGKPTSIRHLVEQHLDERQARIKLNLGYYPYPDYEPMAFWGKSEKYIFN